LLFRYPCCREAPEHRGAVIDPRPSPCRRGNAPGRAAIYVRISTGRQERDQTIDSQLTALRQWAQAHGHDLRPEDAFTDEGYSGSRLDRPGLDRLRDAAREGEFDVLAVLSPDRLARKYAYQALLLEEFRKDGREVAFVNHPISEDPHDQLLLQIQGAVA